MIPVSPSSLRIWGELRISERLGLQSHFFFVLSRPHLLHWCDSGFELRCKWLLSRFFFDLQSVFFMAKDMSVHHQLNTVRRQLPRA